jgi:hypothetical protein
MRNNSYQQSLLLFCNQKVFSKKKKIRQDVILQEKKDRP